MKQKCMNAMEECLLSYLVDVGEKNKGKNIQKFSVKMWGNRLPSLLWTRGVQLVELRLVEFSPS